MCFAPEALSRRSNWLKMAKVDITTDQPLLNTIEHIGNMIDQIIELTDQIEAA
jgi:hypothetical protein